MKIKKKIKGKVAKFDNGGKKRPQEESWTMSTPTTNQITTNDTYSSNFGSDINQNAWTNQNTAKPSGGQQFGNNMLSSLPALGQSINAVGNSDIKNGAKVEGISNAIGDTTVSNIPGFGQFYGAVRGVSSGIQGALPGDTQVDPKTGLSYTKKDSKFSQGFNTMLEPAHNQASRSWGKAAAATSSKDKAKYAFEGIGDMFGFTAVPKMIANAMGKDEDSVMHDKLKATADSEEWRRQHPDISTFAYGGGINKYGGGGSSKIELERYSLPSHAQQNSEVPNTHLDGKPIQIDKHETILREKGNNYVYSDTIKNNTGNTFAKDSILIKDRYKKPHYDSIAESTSADELKSLTVKNDLARQMQEMKSFGGMFKFGGSIPKAEWGKRGYGLNGSGIPINKPDMDFQMRNNGMLGNNDFSIQKQLKESSTLPSYTDIKAKYNSEVPVTPETPQNEQKNPNKWGLDGDQLQLAGTLPAIAYNTAMSMQPADKEPTYYNPYQDKIKDIYSNRRFNEQQVLNENQLTFNKGREDIDGLSTNTRNGNLVALNSSMMEANSKAISEGQRINNGLRAEEAGALDGLGQQRVAEDRRVSEINAQNKGKKQLFAAEAATQSGQALTEAGKAKNQNLTNQIELSALNNIYADFGTKYKNIADFKANASREEIIAFNKYQEEQKAVPRMTIKKAKK